MTMPDGAPSPWMEWPLVKRIDWLCKKARNKGLISVATQPAPALALLSTKDVTFTFDVPQTDTNYEIFVDFIGSALGRYSFVEKSKNTVTDPVSGVTTSPSCTLTMTALVAISVGSGTIRVRAIQREG